jgi:biopolymer transport protein ExbD
VSYSDLHGRFLSALLHAAKSGTPLPEVHIRADKNVRFEAVGRAILAAQQAGVPKVGFITEPRNEGP